MGQPRRLHPSAPVAAGLIVLEPDFFGTVDKHPFAVMETPQVATTTASCFADELATG